MLNLATPAGLDRFCLKVDREATHPEGTPAASFVWEGFVDGPVRADSQDLYADALAVMERSLLTQVLLQTRLNQPQAAKVLEINLGSLGRKIRTLGIEFEWSVWSIGGQAGCWVASLPHHTDRRLSGLSASNRPTTRRNLFGANCVLSHSFM